MRITIVERSAAGDDWVGPTPWRIHRAKYRDPRVGRRLAHLLVQAGARPVASRRLSLSCCAGEVGFTDHSIGTSKVLLVGGESHRIYYRK